MNLQTTLTSFLLAFTLLFFGCSSESNESSKTENTSSNDTNSIKAFSNEKVEYKASGGVAYSWRQLSGTTVILINPHTDTLSFIAPEVTQEESLVFELEIVKNKKDTTTLKQEIRVIVLPAKSTSDTDTTTGQTVTPLKDTNVTAGETNSTNSSSTTTSKPLEIINGHMLPPEPDETLNNSTLLGIDTNNNGVRDDVERWIYETYKDKHPIYIDIAMQAGRAYKKVLETPERALEIHNEVNSATTCQIYYKYESKYFNEPILIQEDAVNRYFRLKIYYNTKERMDAYLQYDKLLSGGVYTLLEAKEQKAQCDFNTSKYEE